MEVVWVFFSSVWDGIKSVGKTVAKVVKKVYEVVTDDRVKDTYEELERIVSRHREREITPQPQYSSSMSTFPRFARGASSPDSQVQKKFEEYDKELDKHKQNLASSEVVNNIQNELSRLNM
ncbi:hypothetical protein [Maridesulfovibrio sp.]|uniref:hypothetical protein n=1 Tax=Maridesulfovibrio sp. TaxID=2795000 RepID=UPI0029CA29DA|nr:hypothetical protein [Maridesulfovibrio sp.]